MAAIVQLEASPSAVAEIVEAADVLVRHWARDAQFAVELGEARR